MAWAEIGPPWWDDAPVYIIGGGPSLRGVDLQRLKGQGHIVAVNVAAWEVPATCLVSSDLSFIKNNQQSIAWFQGEVWCAVGPGRYIGQDAPFNCVRHGKRWGLSDTPSELTGRNSGHTALNVAYLKRARRIILLGFDMKVRGEYLHWHDWYTDNMKGMKARLKKWAESLDACANQLADAGIAISNACSDSAITAFPKCDLEDALP